jgi:hypothetical protein
MVMTMSVPAAPPKPGWTKRSRRICIEAHTEFVATLVTEMQRSVERLQAAKPGSDGFDRHMKDIARLVELLDAVDGPAEGRRLSPLNLAGTISDAAQNLDLAVNWSGVAGDQLFLADGAAVRTAIELLLLALSGDGPGGPVEARIVDDYTVALSGTMDLTDARRCWQLRSGRRVVEAEGFRVSLATTDDGYQVKLRVAR